MRKFIVGGVSESAAVTFLVQNSKLEEKQAEAVVKNLTGGRLNLILMARPGDSYEGVFNQQTIV